MLCQTLKVGENKRPLGFSVLIFYWHWAILKVFQTEFESEEMTKCKKSERNWKKLNAICFLQLLTFKKSKGSYSFSFALISGTWPFKYSLPFKVGYITKRQILFCIFRLGSSIKEFCRQEHRTLLVNLSVVKNYFDWVLKIEDFGSNMGPHS